jgi:hypothetical protein
VRSRPRTGQTNSPATGSASLTCLFTPLLATSHCTPRRVRPRRAVGPVRPQSAIGPPDLAPSATVHDGQSDRYGRASRRVQLLAPSLSRRATKPRRRATKPRSARTVSRFDPSVATGGGRAGVGLGCRPRPRRLKSPELRSASSGWALESSLTRSAHAGMNAGPVGKAADVAACLPPATLSRRSRQTPTSLWMPGHCPQRDHELPSVEQHHKSLSGFCARRRSRGGPVDTGSPGECHART